MRAAGAGMTPVLKLASLAALILPAMAQVQDWRYDGKLAKQAGQFQTDLDAIGNAAAAQARAELEKRLATEQQLAASDQQHTKELTDAQRNQALLRDRLATADVRLSVLLDATDSASGCNVPATPGGAGVRMFKELSPSPTPVAKTDRAAGVPVLCQGTTYKVWVAFRFYLAFGAAFPRPPPEGLPVVLGRFGTAGALEPPPPPAPLPVDPELLLLPPDLDMTFSLYDSIGLQGRP
eukprot:gene9840-11499_t